MFRETEYDTAPSPVPWAPAVIVSHGEVLPAVQLHGPGVDTVTVPVPPSFVNDVRSALTWYSQATLAASWFTVTASPAIVSVPLRELLAVFGDTVMLTLPAPVPLAPLATVIQLASERAVHEQLLSVLTVIAREPPAAWIEMLVAESV
jgi:hypothetical protein